MKNTNNFTDEIIQNMPNAFAYHRIVTNQDGNPVDYEYIYVNKSFELMIGLTSKAIIGKKTTEIMQSINQSEFDWKSFYGEISSSGKNTILEQFDKALNKHYSIKVYYPEQGYFVTIFDDISEYKIKEQALNNKNEVLTSIYEELASSEEELKMQNEELHRINGALYISEDRLKRSQALAHVGNWEVDLATNQYMGSEEALRLYGLNTKHSDTYIPFDLALKIVYNEDRPRKDLAYKNLIENNLRYDVEFRIKHAKTDQERIIHSVATLVFDDSGTPKKASGVLRDITELKQAEQSLKQANEKLLLTYEDLLASEEELRNQYEEISRTNNYLIISKDRLKRAQAIAQVGNWELDLTTNEMWASTEAFRLYGLKRLTPILPLDKVQKIVYNEDRQLLDQSLKLLIEENAKYDINFRITNAATGEKRILHSVASLDYNDNDMPFKVLGVIQDVTELKKAEYKLIKSHEELTSLYEELTATEEELRINYRELELKNELIRSKEERYKLSIEGSNDGVWDWDIVADRIFLSDRCLEIADFTSNHIENFEETFKSRLHPDDVDMVYASYMSHFAGETPYSITEYRLKDSYGAYKWVIAKGKAMFGEDGRPIRMAGSLTDNTKLKKHQQTIHDLAYYDSLTGLPNRVLFEDRLNNAISLAKRTDTKLAVIYFDLDDFKKINDTMGHFFGNELLKKVSDHLKIYIRDCDTLARLGGDEFAILLQNVICIEDILNFGDRLKEAFNNFFLINNTTVYIKSSFGLAIYPEDGQTLDELLKNADTAMYKAKELGKNNFQAYNIHMKYALMKKIGIEKNLRTAISNNEFVLHFQPQINIKTGLLRGFEALIRWVDPEGRLIPPLEFIPIAEETGLIVPIGEWVLRQACTLNKLWQKKTDSELIVSVNISTIQLKQQDFVQLVKNVLLETDYKPELLELELTESVLIDSFKNVIPKLDELKAMGIRLSMDDFGTGYSSLNYLRMLPIHTLKIDKSFIHDIKNNSFGQGMADSIISLVHKLNLEIVAEGVETHEQLDYLNKSECDIVQGYLISKPLSETEIINYLNNSLTYT